MFEIDNEVALEAEGKKALCRLVAWKLRDKRGYLLTEPPLVKGGFPPLRMGHRVMVRMESGGRRYGINTVFVELLKKTGLMMFTFLEDMEIRPMRAERRTECVIPVTVAGAAADNGVSPIGKGIIIDVSGGGTAFYSRDALDLVPGNDAFISFRPGGMGEVKDLKMNILRTKLAGQLCEYSGKFETEPGDEGCRNNLATLDNYLRFCDQWAKND